MLRDAGRPRVVGDVLGGPGHRVRFARQAVSYGLATADDLEEIAAAWGRWAAAGDGWLGMLHGEVLIRV